MSAGQEHRPGGGDDGRPDDPQRQATPRRRLTGIGFVLLGAYFAVEVTGLRGTTPWWWVLLVVGVVVAGYGALQLLPPRR